jgi:hypothetical protein
VGPRGFGELNRRQLVGGGLSAVALGLLRRHGLAFPPSAQAGDSGAVPLHLSHPIARVPNEPDSLVIDGLPFARWFTGDSFGNPMIPFHGGPAGCTDPPPAPREEVDVAVVGGGLSGLAAAYMLREYEPVVFDLRSRFGGAAQGEVWNGTQYSLGSAYVITPDAGTFLDDFYRELRLDQVVRVDGDDANVELGGKILESIFDVPLQDPELAEAFRRYRQVVELYAGESYPDIPPPALGDGRLNELDRRTLKEDIERAMGMRVPQPLAGYIQAYCYSSFAAGWEEISAASGWNFLAAEEFGRWVFPGGNAYIARQLFEALARMEGNLPGGSSPKHLRGGCAVIDVRLVAGDRVQVTYVDARGNCHSLLAKRVVMACPKLTAKHIIHDLPALDERKSAAMFALEYRAYAVVNVLLDAPVDLDFYDIYLHMGPGYPSGEAEVEELSRVTDLLNGHFARKKDLGRSVFTLYWPLPFDSGRWTLLHEDGFFNYARSLAPQIRRMLELHRLPESAVKQVRMTRWGHPIPIARPGLIADGVTESLRRPLADRIYFINQDNWALPAVENCLLDAEFYVSQLKVGL